MLDAENQSCSVNAVLSRILTRSNHHLNSRPRATCPPSLLPGRHRVDLPDPPALLPALVAAGARQDVAQAMQAAYHQRACEFREQALSSISRACSKLAQIPSTYSNIPDEAITAAFQQIYLKKLDSWISEGVALLQEKGPSVLCCGEGNEKVQVKPSKTFNHQYVPFLEHFFKENPFPTHADKVFLAKKSSMTYRQIHVWFQNRRNRTKRAPYKKPITEGVATSLDTLTCSLGKFDAVPTRLDAPSNNRGTPVGPFIEVYNPLDGVTPLHAYPRPYPPSCEYEPFSTTPTFSIPEWPRRLASSPERPCEPIMGVDELTEKFSRLNVWDDTHSHSQRKAGNMACVGSAATSAITVKPSSAPHPACIRTAIVPPLPRMTLQAIPAPASSLHVFRSPSPGSPMATLIPSLARRRKIAPLPNRIPSRPLSTSGGEISRSLTSPSQLMASSRSSSLGTETSIRDTQFTDNSLDPSSAVTTPET